MPKKTSSTSEGLIPSALSIAAINARYEHLPGPTDTDGASFPTFDCVGTKLRGSQAGKRPREKTKSVTLSAYSKVKSSIWRTYPRNEPTGVRAEETT